jgi:vesicle-fusing ATPase
MWNLGSIFCLHACLLAGSRYYYGGGVALGFSASSPCSVHPESWNLGDGGFADAHVRSLSKVKANEQPLVDVAGRGALTVGKVLLDSRMRSRSTPPPQTTSSAQPSHRRLAGNEGRSSGLTTTSSSSSSSMSTSFDADALGVGGLWDALDIIRRRVWVPLRAPKALLDDLGVAPVTGLLLHGPPGNGKTLLAKNLASVLTPRPPSIVSGPEVLDRFVGASEANIRGIFDYPPAVPAGTREVEDTALHIIIFDEFDSVGGARGDDGSRQNGDRVRDSIVNQLLATMDGVESLVRPTLVVALTNRIDLIDRALLRPGRFDVHIHIGMPDLEGRLDILRIHTQRMFARGRLELAAEGDEGYAQFLRDVAGRTEGMSGADLAGITQAAASYALERAVERGGDGGPEDVVTADDFERGLADMHSRNSKWR